MINKDIKRIRWCVAVRKDGTLWLEWFDWTFGSRTIANTDWVPPQWIMDCIAMSDLREYEHFDFRGFRLSKHKCSGEAEFLAVYFIE